MTERARAEHGFTMVEVIVAMTVTAIIGALLAGAFGVASRTFGSASDQIAASVSAGSLNTYLPPDVQGATGAVASATGVGIACGGVSDPRLELLLPEGRAIVYGVRPAGDDWVLDRHQCTGGTSSSSLVVARGLTGPDAVTPERIPATGTFAGASLRVASGSPEEPRSMTISGRRRNS